MATYDLQIEARPTYLFVRVRGQADSVEISLAYWREVAAALRRTGRKRVLVVEELQTAASPVDTFEVASQLAEIGFRGMTVAFVDLEADHLPNNEFGQNVACNRGVHGRLFPQVALAEEWLESLAQRDRNLGPTPRLRPT